MRTCLIIFFCTVVTMNFAFALQGTVVPIPATPGTPTDTRFSLVVNGKEVFVGQESSAGERYSVAYFDVKGKVTVEATASKDIGTYKIMPSRHGIKAKKKGRTLSFSFSDPKNIVVRVDGVGDLLLIATPLETDVPDPKQDGVHFYGPGTHNVGRLKVKNNETVYIAGGARFVGTIEGEGVKNVKILGRGVIDGSKHTSWDKRIFALVFDRSRNIEIEGIRIREAYWWVTEFLLCEKVSINHMFILSNHRNNGGIMADGCNELTVKNSFFITNDDCICPHALNAAGNGEPIGNNFLFEDCVLWQTMHGNCIRIGASFETGEVLNWTFRRIDCIAHKGAAIYSDHSDWATVRNLRFIDFYDEQKTGWTVNMFIKETSYSCNTGYRNKRGNFDGLYFVNLKSPGGGIKLSGHDPDHKFDNVYFYNCKIGSKVIESVEDISINEHVKNLKFITNGQMPPENLVTPLPFPATTSPKELIIDNTSPEFRTAGFKHEHNAEKALGGDIHTAEVPSGFSNFKAAIYEPRIEGKYDVYLHWGDHKGVASNARWIVHHRDGYSIHYLNQNSTPGWHHLGRFDMEAVSAVRLALPGYFSIADNPVVADAVKFVRAVR